jgi:endonuclease V-like protein UPF0215 family
LASQRLRQTKREIRVLGIAVGSNPRGFDVIGVVYRGALWLDGVLRAHSGDNDLTQAIADMVMSSPHSGQIRIILLSEANMPVGTRVSMEVLHARTGKPVIFLWKEEGSAFYWRRGGEKVAFSAAGLGRWSAESVLKVATRGEVTPEALRVAALTLSALQGG